MGALAELEVAVQAAREAGAIALDHAARGVELQWKGERDVVTAADLAAQRRIIDRITEAFPGDLVVAEEGRPLPEGEVAGHRRWYVDPVDGTTNFLKGRHWWGVAIAYCDTDDRLVAGATYLPALDELFAAAAGHGATCNGAPIRCSQVDDLGQALCVTGFPGSSAMLEVSQRNLSIWQRLLPKVLSLRATGAVAGDWCSVACGQADAAWTLGVGRWDIAAGIVIAREAGAVVTDLDGAPMHKPATAGVAASPGIHADLLELLSG